ncbi:MAG TPA: hypothetical protein VM869_21835 [Enhygromyxa sp.]|nr:hypothetical protein [Enhygromyxa sp.]
MTDFLPNAPRRKWHPSEWNIVCVGSAIGTALALGACTDDTTTADDQAEMTTGTDYTDYTDYSDYSDWTDYTDYTDSYWYPECYVDEDCGPDMQCIDYYCVPVSECRTSSDCPAGEFCDDNQGCEAVELAEQCLAPALQQIPLPDEAGGVVVALRFADLDGDLAQELVLLRDDAIVVVDGDQATTATHSAFALDGLATTDVDEDGVIDVVATSSTKLNARVFHGDGLGGFVDSGVGPAMRLDQVHGIDWPADGRGELLALTQNDEAVILSNIDQPRPGLEQLGFGGVIDGLAVGHFDGNGQDDLVALQGCMPFVDYQGGISLGSDGVGPSGPCSVATGNFDGDEISDIVILRADASFSVVTVLAPPDDLPVAVGLIGAYQAARPSIFGGASFSIVVQSGPALELLFTTADFDAWCRAGFDELPSVLRFAVGDFDGDGDDELATVDTDGAVALWSDE